jgi:fluoride exporter
MLINLVMIALGGAVGSVLRYVLAQWTDAALNPRGEHAFPWGTLTVNVLGCASIGLLGALFATSHTLDATPPREEHRLLLVVGLLGGFTTFSAFGLDTLHLLRDGRLAAALVNVLITNLACIAAVWAMYLLAERAMHRG